MLKLQTVFPYGLNDRIGDEYTNFAVAKRFPPLNRSHPRFARESLPIGTNQLICFKFLRQLKKLLNNHLPEALNFIRVSVSSFKKKELKKLAELADYDILSNSDRQFDFHQWYSVILDLIGTKFYRQKILK